MAPALLIRLSALGDVLLAIPAARALAAGGEQVHWVLNRRWEELSEFLPAQVHFLSGLSDLLPLSRKLRKLGISANSTFDLQGKLLSLLLCACLGGSTDRYKKRTACENLDAWRGTYPLHPQNSDPVWKRFMKIVRAPELEKPQAELVLTKQYIEECRRFLSRIFPECENGFIAFHPGASHPGKQFTSESISFLLQNIARPVLLIGDRPDPSFQITGFSGVSDARSLVPLRMLPGVLKLSSGLITSDSGPMHLGRAVAIPLAACFFQTDPCLGFSPIPGGQIHLISRSIPCKPCSLHGQRSTCPTGCWDCRKIDWASELEAITRFFSIS